MSLESTGAYEQRLLPAAIEDRLVGWFGRAGGIGLIAVTAVLWTAVITWSVKDPSLTHATGGSASNALGIPGAIVSDLMLQTLGLGAVVALLAPMLWALELVAAQRIRDFRAKASFYPLAVLILSGGLSALPVAAVWPLNHGYGGILGDLVYGLTANVFAILNPERGGLAAGVVLFTGGFATLLTSIGIELNEIAGALTPKPRVTAAMPTPRAARGLAGFARLFARRPGGSTHDASGHAPVYQAYEPRLATPHGPGWSHEWQAAATAAGYAQHAAYGQPSHEPAFSGQSFPSQSFPSQNFPGQILPGHSVSGQQFSGHPSQPHPAQSYGLGPVLQPAHDAAGFAVAPGYGYPPPQMPQHAHSAAAPAAASAPPFDPQLSIGDERRGPTAASQPPSRETGFDDFTDAASRSIA